MTGGGKQWRYVRAGSWLRGVFFLWTVNSGGRVVTRGGYDLSVRLVRRVA